MRAKVVLGDGWGKIPIKSTSTHDLDFAFAEVYSEMARLGMIEYVPTETYTELRKCAVHKWGMWLVPKVKEDGVIISDHVLLLKVHEFVRTACLDAPYFIVGHDDKELILKYGKLRDIISNFGDFGIAMRFWKNWL